MVSVSVLEDKYVYSLSVFKGGNNADFEANANICTWSEEELAVYNQSRGTSYVSLPSGLYIINPQTFAFTEEEILDLYLFAEETVWKNITFKVTQWSKKSSQNSSKKASGGILTRNCILYSLSKK